MNQTHNIPNLWVAVEKEVNGEINSFQHLFKKEKKVVKSIPKSFTLIRHSEKEEAQLKASRGKEIIDTIVEIS